MRSERLFSGSTPPYQMLCLIPLLMVMFVIADAQSTGVITGRAITEDGKGVPQIDVSIYTVGSGPRRAGYAPAVTDEEGNFRFAGLPPSPYRIDIREAGEYAVLSISGTGRFRGRYFYIGDHITIKLVKGGAITGKVITPNGEPLVRAQVSPIMVRDAEGNPVRQSYGGNGGESLASLPRRVKVKGRDVTGIESKLAPAASISGKIVFEQSPGACQSETMARREEILVSARRARVSPIGNDSSGPALSRFSSGDYSPDDNGQFTIPGLSGGNYYLESVLPDDSWYLKSIITPPATPAQGPAAAPGSISIDAANGLKLEPGDNLTDVTLVVAEGAAGLQGKIAPRIKGSPLPSRLRLYLVPIETSAANDPLRYAETLARSDRTFEFINLAPGKYWLTASGIPGLNQSDPSPLPAVWNPTERTKLRKEAQARKIEIELKPCQRASDQVLRF